MRRAVLTLGGTLAGLAALLSFKTHPGTSDAASPAMAPAAAPTTGAPSAKASATPSVKAGGGTSDSTSARVITGKVASTLYGPMQVQITLTGQKITAVKVLQQTDTGIESQQIDAGSIPTLTKETLSANSARIDSVSGATQTSQGYIQSLQSALDQV